MSDDFAKVFLIHTPFPPRVATAVVAAYRHRYADQLAMNAHLGPAAVPLVKETISEAAVLRLVEYADPLVLAVLLSTKEHRVPVLDCILGTYSNHSGEVFLSEADQLSFVTRTLPERIANEVLSKNFTKAAQQVAALSAHPEHLTKWLQCSHLESLELLTQLKSLAKKGAYSLDAIVPFLLDQPELRPLALRSGSPALAAAACWTELSLTDQALACDFAMATTPAGAYPDPVIGMLAQPSLSSELRHRLWEHLEQPRMASALASGVRFPGSALHKGVPISQLDTASIDTLLDTYAMTPLNLQTQFVAASTLVEISRHPHLEQQQLHDLAWVLVRHAAQGRSGAEYALFPALLRVAQLLNPKVPPIRALRLYGIKQRVIKELTEPAPLPYRDAVCLESHPSWTKPADPPARDIDVSRVLDRQMADIWNINLPSTGVLDLLLVEQLGDGSTEQSLSSWLQFVALALDSPPASLGEVMKTARILASAT